jgi:hypothetical protein
MPAGELPNPIAKLFSFKHARLREDIEGVAFHPPYLIGPHKLVILDPRTRILFFYRPAEEETFCRIQAPPDITYPADWLLSCSGLASELSIELIRDFRALSWLLICGRASELDYSGKSAIGYIRHLSVDS